MREAFIAIDSLLEYNSILWSPNLAYLIDARIIYRLFALILLFIFTACRACIYIRMDISSSLFPPPLV